MASTVKAIIDEFCDRILVPRPSAYVGVSQPAPLQYLSLYRFIGKQLLRKGNWPQLKRLYTFTTQTNVSNYQLPGDYARMLQQTQWSVTNQIALSGPLSDSALSLRTYGVTPVGFFTGFQVNGPTGYTFNTAPYTQVSAGYFQISPAGQNNTDQNVIAYMSNNFTWPTAWLPTHAYVLGDKVSGVANIYICTTAGTSGSTRPSAVSGTQTDGTVTWTVYTEPYAVSADTDFCLFDDELIIEGMRWAWFRAKKQDYQQELLDWNNAWRVALGSVNGGGYVNAGYNADEMYEWPVTPSGGWNV